MRLPLPTLAATLLLAAPALAQTTRPAATPTDVPSDAVAPAPGASAGTGASAGPGASAPDYSHRVPHARPAGGAVTTFETIQDLGNFDYDPDTGGLPDDVLALDGATVRLSGFMIPLTQAGQVTQFALVPSLFACCFGQPPQLQHTVVVDCPAGKSVPYYPDQITVQGTIHVGEKREDGYVISLYEMDADSVKAK